jgi:bifunctional N-acetylglucosamine-1-phosphate-uridyltransferase/glucosamine-1-phosphate-acetyltransferase GlmU-like protein
VKPDLVVMAAGMGSRFGGLKQLEGVGPNSETVMDYSIFDAKRAGIDRVVFVIRRDIEEAFRNKVGTKYERWMEVAYAFQELDLLPPGFSVPEGRTKPWGTGHAVLAAKAQVKAPFLVINADDFYGAEAYRILVRHLSTDPRHAMVAFKLSNTLSDHGSVSRGICRVSPEGFLQGVTEHTNLEASGCEVRETLSDGSHSGFLGTEPVSMNFWGFQPSFMSELEARFLTFMELRGREQKSEYYLPSVVDAMISEGRGTVSVLESPDRWFGVTYREDKPIVESRIRTLVSEGKYPENLWK